MAWITLAEARAASGASGDTAADAKAIAGWLAENGASFETSSHKSQNLIFARDGMSFVQAVATTVVEYRGLAQDCADFLAEHLNEDDTRSWNFYGVSASGEVYCVEATYGPPASSSVNGAYYKVGETGSWKLRSKTVYLPTNGTSVDAQASRANDSGGYLVSATTTVYEAPDYHSSARKVNVAFIPVPPTEASSGIVVSVGKTKTYLSSDHGTDVFQNTTTVVKEYRYLSSQEAEAKVASEQASNSRTYDVSVVVSWGSQGTYTKNIQTRGGANAGRTAATDKTAVSRPMGDGLCCVTVTETTYQVTTS